MKFGANGSVDVVGGPSAVHTPTRRLLVTTLLALATAAALAMPSSASTMPTSTRSLVAHVDLESLFPTPSTPSERLGAAGSLAELLDALSESTGVLYFPASAAIAAALKERREFNLSSSGVAAANAYTFVESQLVAHGFSLVCNGDVTPTTAYVHRSHFSSPSSPLLLGSTRDDVERMRAHPALQFTTTIEPRHLEVRTLPSQLSPLLGAPLAGARGIGIAPVGFSRAVAMTGGGADLAAAVELVRKLDAEKGAAARAAAKPAGESVLESAFPTPKDALLVPAGSNSLTELLAALSRASGATYTFDAGSKDDFESARVSLRQSITLHPEQAYVWIESQLLAQGFCLVCDLSSRPAAAQVRKLNQSAAEESNCLTVGVGELDFIRRHPALGFATTLRLEHLDARVLPSLLRVLAPSDPRVGTLESGADAQRATLRGHGQFVAQTVDLLRRLDADAGRTVSGPTPDDRKSADRDASKR